MKKTFKSTLSRTNMLVNYKGEIIHVTLEPDVINEFGLRGCSFTTEDEELQKAIMAHPEFSKTPYKGIWTDPEDEDVKGTTDEVKKPRKIKSK